MKTVIIVKESLDEHLSPIISSVFDSVQVIHSDEDVLSLIYMDPPDIILIDRTYLQEHDGAVVNEFRSNTIYGHLPVVAIYTEKDIENPSALDIPLDDFIVLSDSELQIKRRIEFVARRSMRAMDTNPLTRLPGNESIMRSIQQMFDEGKEIAIAWADLDNFKPYNDRYGFSSGDEVLLATARIITNAVKEIGHGDTFVGHVGGRFPVRLPHRAREGDLRGDRLPIRHGDPQLLQRRRSGTGRDHIQEQERRNQKISRHDRFHCGGAERKEKV